MDETVAGDDERVIGGEIGSSDGSAGAVAVAAPGSPGLSTASASLLRRRESPRLPKAAVRSPAAKVRACLTSLIPCQLKCRKYVAASRWSLGRLYCATVASTYIASLVLES